MYLKLLYIIILIAASRLMSSCTSQNPEENDLGKSDEVTFIVSDQSRASVITDISYTDSKFAVYGDMKFKNNPPTTIFDNNVVRYSDGKWVYDNIQYWFHNHEHSFVAIYPYDAASASYSNSTLSFTYTLPENFADTPDIMAATHRRMHKDNPSSPASPVKFGFFHILSRINFQLTNNGAADIVRVDEIKLEGINKTGTYTITPAPLSSGIGQTQDYDFSWSGISNKGNLTANINVDIPENETRMLFPDDNDLFMIPQSDNNDVIMHLTYTMIEAGSNNGQLTLTAAEPIGGWEPGKAYTYSMTVSEITKEIYLTVSVKDWHKPKDTSVPVPES